MSSPTDGNVARPIFSDEFGLPVAFFMSSFNSDPEYAKERIVLQELIEMHGGIWAPQNGDRPVMHLIRPKDLDAAQRGLLPGKVLYLTTYIEACVKHRRLLDNADYEVRAKKPKAPRKYTNFTPEDDEAIISLVRRKGLNDPSPNGDEFWIQASTEFGDKHTWQSLKNRWKKYLYGRIKDRSSFPGSPTANKKKVGKHQKGRSLPDCLRRLKENVSGDAGQTETAEEACDVPAAPTEVAQDYDMEGRANIGAGDAGRQSECAQVVVSNPGSAPPSPVVQFTVHIHGGQVSSTPEAARSSAGMIRNNPSGSVPHAKLSTRARATVTIAYEAYGDDNDVEIQQAEAQVELPGRGPSHPSSPSFEPRRDGQLAPVIRLSLPSRDARSPQLSGRKQAKVDLDSRGLRGRSDQHLEKHSEAQFTYAGNTAENPRVPPGQSSVDDGGPGGSRRENLVQSKNASEQDNKSKLCESRQRGAKESGDLDSPVVAEDPAAKSGARVEAGRATGDNLWEEESYLEDTRREINRLCTLASASTAEVVQALVTTSGDFRAAEKLLLLQKEGRTWPGPRWRPEDDERLLRWHMNSDNRQIPSAEMEQLRATFGKEGIQRRLAFLIRAMPDANCNS